MSMFKKLHDKGLEKPSEDRVGGGFQVLNTGIYNGVVKELWGGYYDGGSMFVSGIIDIDGTQLSFQETITNSQGEHFFIDKKDGKKKPLPGYTKINDLCMLATEQPLWEQETEDKVVQVWDRAANGRVNKTVPMMVDAVGQEVAVVLRKVTRNKQEKDQRTGKYVDVAGEYTRNEVQTFLTPDHVSMREIEREMDKADKDGRDFEMPEPGFAEAWKKANPEDKVYDFRTVKDGESGREGRPGRQRSAPTESNSGSDDSGSERRKPGILGRRK